MISNVCGGTQNVLVTDINGCTLLVNPVLVSPPAIQINMVSMTESSCGFNSGELVVNAVGPNPPFNYSINGGALQSSGTFPDLFAGAYEVLAVDNLGCQAQIYFGVNDIQMDGIMIAQTDPLCFGSFDGTVEVTNVNGVEPITYELNNSGVTQASGFFGGLSVGSHIITIYDFGYCVFTIPVNLVQPAPIVSDHTITDVACFGASTGEIEFTATTGGTAPYMYSADGGNNFVPGTTFTNLSTGTYDLMVTDAHGCIEAASVDVLQIDPMEISNNKADLTCFQNNTGFIQLGASGGNSGYQYSIDNGATFSATSSFFNLGAQVYNVVVMDQEGCLQDTTVTLTEPAALVAGVSATDVLCNNVCNGTVSGTGTGGIPAYMFSVDGGTIFNVTGNFTDLCSGAYDLIIKDLNACSDTVGTTIGTPAATVLSIALTASTCSNPNGAITMNLTGGTMPYSYSIDNGTTFTASGAFTGLLATDYPLEAQDANGCSIDSIVAIVDQASPVISGVYVTEPTCFSLCDAIAKVSATGGSGALSFEMNGISQTDTTFSNLCAGTYDVIVTDVNTCKDTLSVTIDQPDTLTFTTVAANLTCFQDQSGSITATVQGGTAPFQYSFDNGVSFGASNSAQVLAAGNYAIVVRDNNNCSANGTQVVTEPALLTATLNITDPTCFSFCDGSAVATVTGGTLG